MRFARLSAKTARLLLNSTQILSPVLIFKSSLYFVPGKTIEINLMKSYSLTLLHQRFKFLSCCHSINLLQHR